MRRRENKDELKLNNKIKKELKKRKQEEEDKKYEISKGGFCIKCRKRKRTPKNELAKLLEEERKKKRKSEINFDLKYNLRKVRKYLEDRERDKLKSEFMSLVFDKLASSQNEGVKYMRHKEFYDLYNGLCLVKDKVQPQLRSSGDLRPDVIYLRELENEEHKEFFDETKFKKFGESQSIEIYSNSDLKTALGSFL